ncbi:biotin--[acetyl-CoA-carboxylase] ligase [Desulfovibrio sp. DS-1]|nr:biotin--[acetyl-CoA-carboxylase] ligase [Nitratidesulfovibrio sp. SRB-5]RXF78624.1 biotin--[acetyl-CoA-carboxylase] ligase [Desulfovibrio sp. DS-1]
MPGEAMPKGVMSKEAMPKEAMPRGAMSGSTAHRSNAASQAAANRAEWRTPVVHLLHEGLPQPSAIPSSGAASGQSFSDQPAEDAARWMADPLPPEVLCGLPGWGDDLAAPSCFAPTRLGGVPMLATLPGGAASPEPSAPSPASASGPVAPPVIVCGPCTSSLDVAHALAAAGALPEWGTVLAVSQRAGRGQLRRPWESPPGNIYAALRLPAAGVFATETAAIALGCLFAEAFNALGVPVRLKWPNDLLLGDAKVGGMLIEEKRGVVLAGIGINVVSAPPPQALRQGWAVPAASLAGLGISATPLTLWRHLVEDSRFCYEAQVLRAGGADFVSCAEKHLAWVGRGVVVHGGEVGDCPGRILGLEPQGGLRIVISGREHILRSGSITPIPS